MTFFHNNNYDWSGLIQQLDEQEQQQPEPTTTTTTTPYEFLPEIWNKIKEYAVPKKYEYQEEDCLFKVQIPFLDLMEGYSDEMYDRIKLVVSGDGEEDTTEVSVQFPEQEGAVMELEPDEEYQVTKGDCEPKFNNTFTVEYWLSELELMLKIEDYPEPDGITLVIEVGERGYTKYLTTEGGERIV